MRIRIVIGMVIYLRQANLKSNAMNNLILGSMKYHIKEWTGSNIQEDRKMFCV